jgi:hypothetical protein
MFFQQRELPPYAEPVSANELKEGTVYFELSYSPESMIIPFLETLRFVGKNLQPGDVGLVYFQQIMAHRWVEDESDSEDPWGRDENQLNAHFEFDKALNGLLWCSLRRKKLNAQDTMLFQGKDLRPDPEPLSPNQLRKGSVYFALHYPDEARLIPVMLTVVFIGRNLEAGDKGKLYFQDYHSYYEGFHYNSPDRPSWTTSYVPQSEIELNDVFEFDQMLDEMMRCSLRRAEALSNSI